ncbi:MAG: aldolase [Candidatus Aquicultor primus]|uniref:Aldolase n=1 Tax=Candidatus Aquicultor primus TaxID=1797195 RepID=A0A1F2UFA9_9ACTN|nr:MAG: aldolase [Candidatus Aquicultor primus]
MRDQIEKYTNKLLKDGLAVPGSIRFYALDDELIVSKDDDWKPVFKAVLDELSVVGLLFAAPALPFADNLIARSSDADTRIYPKDSEVKTFLHDIPFIRRSAIGEGGELAKFIAAILRERKGLIIEGVGFVAAGTVTLEQAYITYSSIFHATFIKYLLELQEHGWRLPGEQEALERFKSGWSQPYDVEKPAFRNGPLTARSEIIEEICAVGRYTVENGLVDSFFGNISLFDDGIIYISQTGASLDELEGLIDPVPMDNSSTYGITASSELPVHRRIYETSSYTTIIHGHPKFSVIMSMICEKRAACDIIDCGKDCPETRFVDGVPIVAGEIGAGGIAKTVPPIIKEYGRALVYGHGLFCAGSNDFKDAFSGLVQVETLCRRRYFEMLAADL